MSQKTLNLCLERYNFVKFGETTKSTHTVLCTNNAHSVNSDKYRLTPTAIASKHGEGYVFTLNYDFDRPLFTIVQRSYSLDGTSGNIVFEGIDPISKGGSKYLRKVTVSPVKLSDGSYLLEVTKDEYLRIGTTGAALGDENLESLNEKIVTMGGIEKSVETVGGKQVLKLDASGSGGAKEIVYFDVDPSDPQSGLYEAIGEALSNNKEPVIKTDGAVYFYSSTGTDKYVFVGGYRSDTLEYVTITISDDDSVETMSVEDNMIVLVQSFEISPYEDDEGGGLTYLKTLIDDEYVTAEMVKTWIDSGKLLVIKGNPYIYYLTAYDDQGETEGGRQYRLTFICNATQYYSLRRLVQTYLSENAGGYGTSKMRAWNRSGSPTWISVFDEVQDLVTENQAVLVSQPQSFLSEQKAQGRDNIGAASASDVAALQSQVSSLSDVSAYSVKGEATVAQLNAGPSGIQAGWAYQLTDSGTLTDGNLAVVAGDTVAWDGTKWFPLVKSDYYATKIYAQNVAHSIAPEFDPNRDEDHKYLVNEFVVHVGKLYRFDVNHYGAWDETHVHEADVSEILACLERHSYTYNDYATSANKNQYVNTGVNVGDTVSTIPTASAGWMCVVLECKKNDLFRIKGFGGNNARLWCFLDSQDKVVSVAGIDATLDGCILFASCDGKFVFNSRTSYSPVVEKCELADNFTKKVYKNAFYKIELMQSAVNGKYIKTNTPVGDTVDYTEVANSSYSYVVHQCTAGDKFYLKGSGGGTARLWCFVDSQDKVVSVAGIDATTGGEVVTLMAPCDGSIIINVSKSSSPSVMFETALQPIIDTMLQDISDSKVFKNVIDIFDRNKTIHTNVGVGNVVDVDVQYDTPGYSSDVVTCTAGDKFYLKGSGGGTARLWCFVDSQDKVVSVARIDATTGGEEIELVAKVDGKLIVNVLRSSEPVFRVVYKTQTYIDERCDKNESSVAIMQDYSIQTDLTPFANIMSRISGIIDMTDVPTIMQQVYSGFDRLVTDFPDFVTKYDAAELVDMAYPRYANGISAGDPDYLETPAYKTFLYKLSNTSVSSGNTRSFKKKNLFIIGSTHGVEYLSSVNLLVFAEHICQDISSDLFGLLAVCDVWILPCLNGYGMIHTTRPNADGIDINRNYGTRNWTVQGSPGDDDYSGDTPDSTFENRLVEALYASISVDAFCDHHCTPSRGGSQFYSESASSEVFLRSYKALVDVSTFLTKNYPQYFGTHYQLFNGDVYTQKLPYGLATVQGLACMWFYEQGVKDSVTIEIFGYVNFIDGEVGDGPRYTEEHFAINEYTLRSQLINFIPIALQAPVLT